MEKLSLRKKQNIVVQYFKGLFYDEIAIKVKVSKGTVANVVADLKAGKFPEAAGLGELLESLRELSIDLRRSNLSPGQCAAGLIVLGRIEECGLTPADIDRLPVILKSAGSEEEAREFIGLVRGIHAVQQRTGLSIDELESRVQEMEKKADGLEPLVKQCESLHQDIVGLTGQRDELKSDISGLQGKLELLKTRVSELEQREKALLRRNKDMEAEAERAQSALGALKAEKKALAEVGLSLDELAEINHMAQNIARHHGVTSADLVKKLMQWLKNLDKAMGLEAMIKSQQKELKDQKQAADLARQELDSLQADIGSSKQEKDRFESEIRRIREETAGEIDKIVPSISESVGRWKAELRRGHDEALLEVRRLRDETIAVGIEIGKYEYMVQTNGWLRDLLVLVKGDEAVEAKRLKAIVLPVLNGLAVWLKRKGLYASNYPLSTTTVLNLIAEVEKWEV